MDKESLRKFLVQGVIDDKAKNAFKVMKKADLESSIKEGKKVDIDSELERMDETIRVNKPTISAPQPSNISMDAIMALSKGGKGALEEAKKIEYSNKPQLNEIAAIDKVYTKQSSQEKTFLPSDITEKIKKEIDDYFLIDIVGSGKLEKLIEGVVKKNIKQYLKEVLTELKNK